MLTIKQQLLLAGACLTLVATADMATRVFVPAPELEPIAFGQLAEPAARKLPSAHYIELVNEFVARAEKQAESKRASVDEQSTEQKDASAEVQEVAFDNYSYRLLAVLAKENRFAIVHQKNLKDGTVKVLRIEQGQQLHSLNVAAISRTAVLFMTPDNQEIGLALFSRKNTR